MLLILAMLYNVSDKKSDLRVLSDQYARLPEIPELKIWYLHLKDLSKKYVSRQVFVNHIILIHDRTWIYELWVVKEQQIKTAFINFFVCEIQIDR